MTATVENKQLFILQLQQQTQYVKEVARPDRTWYPSQVFTTKYPIASIVVHPGVHCLQL